MIYINYSYWLPPFYLTNEIRQNGGNGYMSGHFCKIHNLLQVEMKYFAICLLITATGK